ncbi:ATP-binding protein [Kitasatospora sp. NPDC127116]|uniref:ATP-binding protein n=1 Tax=Kitasatospora sp. NPDC127116 TaxID=3345367 RepID=UPI00338610F1
MTQTAAPPSEAPSSEAPPAESPVRPLPATGPTGEACLLEPLAWLERRVHRALSSRTTPTDSPGPPDDQDAVPFTALEAPAEHTTGSSSLHRLARAFGLGPVDLSVFLVALAPDLDSRFERFYACLNDDPTLPHATVALALTLSGVSPLSTTARAVVSPTGPLRSGGLLAVEDSGRPFLSRALCVPDRAADHLLGHDAFPRRLRPFLNPLPTPPPLPGPARATADRLAAILGAPDRRPVHLRHRPGHAGGEAETVAAAAAHALGRPLLRLDWDGLSALSDADALLAEAVLEARLREAALLVVLPPSTTSDHGRAPELWSRLGEAAPVLPLALAGTNPGDAASARLAPVFLECPATTAAERATLWHAELAGLPGLDPDRAAGLMASYRLAPHLIPAVVATARRQAHAMDRAPAPKDLTAAAHLHHDGALGRLARRVDPAAGWTDLVLPDPTADSLRALANRVRHRDRVLGEWGLRPGAARGHGVSALFTGPSGTGKTLAAEVVAADLGFDLHVVDLSTVMSKYIGDTEKHLEHLFAAAEGLNGILLFDEADAVFSKRTAVRDAHDRHANATTAYLLQRLEAFDGVAFLTSNLHANIDNAYLRRFDFVIPFPLPDEEGRRALWDTCLGPSAPRADGLDLTLLARRFELTGGEIRCCATTAAYHAAHDGRPIGTTDLLDAVRIEHHKLNRYVDEQKFSLPGPD